MVKVMRSIVGGPLAPYVAEFAVELLNRGYTRNSAEQHICFIAHLDRWLLAEGLGVADLSETTIERYLIERRAVGYVEYRSAKAIGPLLGFLAPLGVLPASPPVQLDPVEELLGRYRGYLLAERGLTSATVAGYVHVARPFIATRLRGERLDLAGLSAVDVIGFVLASCPGRATGTAKLIVTVTRSLLSWLHLTGVTPVSLASAVPSVAGWKLSGLPQALTSAQIQALLASCDRRTPTGRRDYAVVLLLARLGLRSGEVARLGSQCDILIFDERGLLMLPYFAGERTPILDPQARGTIVGLTLSHTRGDLYRATLEAIGFGVRHNIETMREAGGDVRRIVAVGGGTQGGLWTQVVTDATGLEQVIHEQSIGASYGGALLAAQTQAEVSIEDWNPVRKVVKPQAHVSQVLDELYPHYRELYRATREINHVLAGRQVR